MIASRIFARIFGVALALALVLAAGCDDHYQAGPMQTEDRLVESFDSIDMEGDGRMEITVGSPASLSIKGSQAALRRISTEVRDGTLHIRNADRNWSLANGRGPVKLRISVPSLTSLTLDGGNDVRVKGFDGGKSAIKVQGATHIRAVGRLEELTVHMAGAGHADFSKLVTSEARVTVEGIGSVYVNSQESLDAKMNGVGAIIYSGNPQRVNSSMNGLGTISRHKSESRHAKRHDRRDRHDRHERDEEREWNQEIDPDSLQPEYDDRSNRSKEGRWDKDKAPPGGVTEVI